MESNNARHNLDQNDQLELKVDRRVIQVARQRAPLLGTEAIVRASLRAS